ncbi:MAG: hypothetical protein AAGF95_16725 [Chloroflexota bacterium]
MVTTFLVYSTSRSDDLPPAGMAAYSCRELWLVQRFEYLTGMGINNVGSVLGNKVRSLICMSERLTTFQLDGPA